MQESGPTLAITTDRFMTLTTEITTLPRIVRNLQITSR
jgi:hypothetical protein